MITTEVVQPTVSILLPVYNGQDTIARAIESVLSQTYQTLELLVIDDGSTDNTATVLRTFQNTDSRIKIITHGINQGLQKSLNDGMRQARGMYIARIDADDIWNDSRKLEQQVTFLSDNPDHVLVGTGIIVIDMDQKEMFRYTLPETDNMIRARILGKNCFVHSSVVFLKSAAMQDGGYGQSTQILHVEDYELWLRLGTKGKMHNLQSCSVSFTTHDQSISKRNRLLQCKHLIPLIKQYKNQYPHYAASLMKAYVRVFAQTFFALLPTALQHKIFLIDKKY